MHEIKKRKKQLWVFVCIKVGKFWCVLLGHFVKYKPLICEECINKYYLHHHNCFSNTTLCLTDSIEHWIWKKIKLLFSVKVSIWSDTRLTTSIKLCLNLKFTRWSEPKLGYTYLLCTMYDFHDFGLTWKCQKMCFGWLYNYLKD